MFIPHVGKLIASPTATLEATVTLTPTPTIATPTITPTPTDTIGDGVIVRNNYCSYVNGNGLVTVVGEVRNDTRGSMPAETADTYRVQPK